MSIIMISTYGGILICLLSVLTPVLSDMQTSVELSEKVVEEVKSQTNGTHNSEEDDRVIPTGKETRFRLQPLEAGVPIPILMSEMQSSAGFSEKVVEEVKSHPNGTYNSEEDDRVIPRVKETGFRLRPMAAGGLGLLSGLILITVVIGVFIFVSKSRRSELVYEPASTCDTVEHI